MTTEDSTKSQVAACKHPGVQLRQGSPEFEFFVAKSLLESGGDLRHGANHLANLLSYDPRNAEWLALLEQYIAAGAPDPESLYPRGDELFYTTEAVRAYIWHWQGKLGDAIDLIASVVYAKPDSNYLDDWVLSWLEPEGAVESLPDDTGWQLFSLVLHHFPEARFSSAAGFDKAQLWAHLVERFASTHDQTGRTTMIRCGILRKAAYFDEAIKVATAALSKFNDWFCAITLALAYRSKGDVNAAENAFLQVLKIQADDPVARVEAGDMYFDKREWQNAIRWYQQVLDKEPHHEWAYPSVEYCKYRLSGQEKDLDTLLNLSKEGNDRAQLLVFREKGGLPPVIDATANILRQLAQSIVDDKAKAPTGVVKLKTSSLEPPSNFVAFNMEMEALKHDLKLAATVEDIPRPDPRFPIVTKVQYLIWKYKENDTVAEPALPPPGSDVSHMIAKLANSRYDENENWPAASWIAAELGPEGISEVLSCMVHPPTMPPNWISLDWIPRVQLAAAQVVAQVDRGWEGSARKEALLSILYGPSDWTTQAAIRAMTHLAKYEEVHSVKIGEAFEKLARNRPNSGYCCWEHTLYACWYRLPHLYQSERDEIRDRVKEIEERLNS